MNVVINRQKLGVEDLTFGTSTEQQNRGGSTVTITQINAGNLPFSASATLSQVLDESYPAIEIVGDSIANVNTTASSISDVDTIANNIEYVINTSVNMDSVISALSFAESANAAAVSAASSASAANLDAARAEAAQTGAELAEFNAKNSELTAQTHQADAASYADQSNQALLMLNDVLVNGIGAMVLTDGDLILTYNDPPLSSAAINADGELVFNY